MWVVIVVAMLIAFVGRILGPGDLSQNSDQCKTAAFTMDMLVHGRWLVPVDLTGAQTLKPPMVNYLAVPAVAAARHVGIAGEFAFKTPSLLAALLGAVAVVLAGRTLFARLAAGSQSDEVDHAIAQRARLAGWLCAAAWIASPSTIKHMYFCRPDMLQNALLAWSFAAACVLLTGSTTKPGRWAAVLWIAAGLAAFAKGPMALLVPAFALLGLLLPAVRCESNAMPALARWRTLGLVWGPLVMLAIPALWLVPAYLAEPEHIAGTLLGGEVGNRVSTGGEGLERLPMNALRVPLFHFERFWPWSIGAVIALVAMGLRRVRTHPLAPALLWAVMVTLLLMVVAGESASFNMPAYPALAILGVYGLVRVIAQNKAQRVGSALLGVAAMAVITALSVNIHESFFSRAAKSDAGPRLEAFARQARTLVGDDTVAFVGLGHNPVPLFMGRHPGTGDERLERGESAWVVRPLEAGDEPVLSSDRIVRLRAGGRGTREASEGLGLFLGGLHDKRQPEAPTPTD